MANWSWSSVDRVGNEGLPRARRIAALWTQLEAGTCLLLTGPAGVGKTAAARELLATAQQEEWSTFLIAATPAVQPVSFGAAHSLVDVEALEGVTLLNQALQKLQSLAAGRRQLVVVDDIDALDADSLALVDRLTRDGSTTVIATTRQAHVDDQRVAPLWKDQFLELVDLEPLSRTETDLAVANILGSGAEPELLAEVWDLTHGNPLFVRELLLGARAQGRIIEGDGGRWCKTGPLSTTTRLFGIISDRLSPLSEAQRDTLVTVACSAPITMVALDGIVSSDDIQFLEAEDFIAVSEAGGQRATVTMSHPMIGEVLREGSSRVRRRKLLGQMAVNMLDKPMVLSADDRQRALLWALDAAEDFDRSLLLPAAERALFRFDSATAALLAEPALDFVPSGRAAQILVRALFLTNRHDEAAAAASRGLALAATEEERCNLLVAWADNEMHGRADPASGVLRLQQELDTFKKPQYRAEIEMRIAVAQALLGAPLDTIELAASHIDNVELPIAPRIHILAGLIYAMTMTGNVGDDFDKRRAQGRAITVDNQEFWVHYLLIQLLELVADIQRGELPATLQTAASKAASATDASEAGGWKIVSAIAAAVGGGGSALPHGEAATDALDASDPFGVWLWVRGIAALGHARVGSVDTARVLIGHAEEHDQASQGRLAAFLVTAKAWVLLQQGHPDAAIDEAITGADRAAEEEHYFFAAFAAHEAARMGGSAAVLDRLTDWAAAADAPIIELYRRHASAVVLDDPHELEVVGKRFWQLGAPALGAEALAAAAARSEGNTQLRLATQAQAAAHEDEWLRSPTLSDVIFPLSERELEVAIAAALGMSNKDIANELFVSTRTVGNHLQATYRKLGISKRSELSEYVQL